VIADNPIDGTAPPEEAIERSGGIARSAGTIAAGNISSRILGMGRMTLIAGIFGATGLVSAYQVAATVPTMTYELLVGGVLSSALVPIFSEYAASRHRKELSRLISTVLGITLLILIGVVLLIEIFAPQIARILGGGFPPHLQVTATSLIRVSGVALLFLGLSGVITAVLYTLKRFTLPSFGAAAFNAGIIVCAVLLSGQLGIYSLAIGIVVGSLIQLLIQLPALRGIELGITCDLSHPGLRRIAQLYLPVLAGLVITQVQIAVDRNLASHTGEQSIAWMMNATTLIQFPHGLIAVAISLAVLPSLSRLFAIKDMEGYCHTLSLGLRLVIVLIVPAVVGLFILGRPAVATIFEHGKFTAVDTAWTTFALQFYLFGLVFAAIDWPLNYASYARQDTATPALVGVFSIAIYLGVAFSLLPRYGMIGLVLADSFKQLSHALTMLILTHRRLGGIDDRRVLTTLLKTAVASLIMAGVIRGVLSWLPNFDNLSGFLNNLILLSVSGTSGLITYFLLSIVLGQDEIITLWNTLYRKLRHPSTVLSH